MSMMQQNNSAAMNKVGENYSDVQQYSASDSEVTQNNMSSSDPESSVDHDYDAEQDQEGNTHVAFPADNARKAGMGCWVKVAIVVALVVIAIGIAVVVTFVCVFDNKHQDDTATSGNVVTTSASGVTTPNQTGGGDSDTTTPSSPTDVTTRPAPAVDVCSTVTDQGETVCHNTKQDTLGNDVICTWVIDTCVKNSCAYISTPEQCNSSTYVVEDARCVWARLDTWASNDDKKQTSFLTIVGDAPTLVLSADPENPTTAAVATTSVTDGTSSATASTTPVTFVCGVFPCAYFGSKDKCTSFNKNDMKCSWNPPSTEPSFCNTAGTNEENCAVLTECDWNKDVAKCQAIVKDVGKCVDYKTPVPPPADDSCGAKSSEAEKWNPVNWAKCGFTGNWRAWVLSGTAVLALIYAVVALVKKDIRFWKWGNNAGVKGDLDAGDEGGLDAAAPENFNTDMLKSYFEYLAQDHVAGIEFAAGLKFNFGEDGVSDIATLTAEHSNFVEGNWSNKDLDLSPYLSEAHLRKWNEHLSEADCARYKGQLEEFHAAVCEPM